MSLASLWILLGLGMLLRNYYEASLKVLGESPMLQLEEQALLKMLIGTSITRNENDTQESFHRTTDLDPPKIMPKEEAPGESYKSNNDSNENNARLPSSPSTSSRPSSSRSSSPLSFSACLLVMDENHRLPEWLAYHYFALPLTTLVILVDPRSQTSPKSVLEPWKDLMDIYEWTDKDIQFQPSVSRTVLDPLTRNHRRRQGQFYKYCAKHIQALQQKEQQEQQQQSSSNFTNNDQHLGSWTGFFDVDEYIVLDHVPDKMARMQKQGFVAQFLRDAELCGRDPTKYCYSNTTTTKTETNKNANSTQSTSNIHRIAWSPQLVKYCNDTAYTRQCVVPMRTYYGSKRAPPSHVVNMTALVPSYLQNTSLYEWETLAHLYRIAHTDPRGFGKGKTVWKIPSSSTLQFYHRGQGIHLIAQDCQDGNFNFSPLRIRHYLGSWKVYTSRLDARRGTKRNRQLFDYRSDMGNKLDPDILHWLQNFAALLNHNVTLIQRLLRGSGQVDHMTDPALWEMDREILKRYLDPSPVLPCRTASECFTGIKFFREWLRKRYRIEQLPNGTEVVVEIASEGAAK